MSISQQLTLDLRLNDRYRPNLRHLSFAAGDPNADAK